MPAPDLAGFAAAQQRLRDAFGEVVTFYADETELVWPGGVTIDPETHRPYDPTVVPVSSAVGSAQVKCDVVFKAINRAGIGGEVDFSEAGMAETDHIMLIAPSAAASAIDGKSTFHARDETFKITATKFDGVGAIQRYLTYGRRM